MSLKKAVSTVLSISFKIIILMLVIISVYISGKAAYNFGLAVFTEKAVDAEPGTDVSITITEGASSLSIGKILQENGLIRDYKLFYVQSKVSEYSGDLKPGTYMLNTSMTAEEMMAVMSGEVLEEEEGAVNQ